MDSFFVASTGKEISAGQCAILRPPDPSTQPYIGKVERIEVDNAENAVLMVRWYYRPEESVGGRREFHGSKELFLSDHYDECSPEAVESKCIVHTFKEYTKLENVGVEDYFSRFEYKAAAGTFSPDRVAVYCKCEMPYNPDDLMVQCEQCKDWFHPRCIRRLAEEIKSMGAFVCPDCVQPGHQNGSYNEGS